MSTIDVMQASAEPAPPYDAFYDLPADLANFSPGEIIRSRTVAVNALQSLPIKVDGWQLLYRTVDMNGEPDAAVTTVMAPQGPAKPRPLLSYQAATDSTLRICNPSYGLVHGAPVDFANPSGPVLAPIGSIEVALAVAGLEQGWVVAMPDHGGVDNRFLTPRQPGFAVLDGIRAVENFDPAGLAGTTTPVSLWGYSGGAIASSWAIEQHPTYAPELDIKGAAFGAPERDLEASLKSANGTPFAGLIPLALASIAKDSPAFSGEIKSYLTPEGDALVDRMRNSCAPQNILGNLGFRYENYLTAPIDDVLDNLVIRREIDDRGVSGDIPTVPAYVYNGVTDEIAPISGTDKLVDSYCEGGAPVTYRREALPPNPIPQYSSTHAVIEATGAAGAFKWIKERMSPDSVMPTGCDIQTVPNTLADPDVLASLGPSFGLPLQSILTGTPLGTNR
ncbi:lipase family protein [Rhodococcus qingshengii]|uniref:lipase family protein n=1 Tax=Rhodococcus qingshengii TaxID=334542 RepID=UPI00211F25E5|nr:lipase family protein [Rhodococcus qingshengii]